MNQLLMFDLNIYRKNNNLCDFNAFTQVLELGMNLLVFFLKQKHSSFYRNHIKGTGYKPTSHWGYQFSQSQHREGTASAQKLGKA